MADSQYCPPDVCRPLLYSSQLFLFITATAFYYHFYLLGTLILGMYMTSMLHWTYPDSIALRYVDMSMVFASFSCATYIAFLFTKEIATVWCTAVGMILFVFLGNAMWEEKSMQKEKEKNATPSIWKRSVFVHMIFVHVLPTFLAIFLLYKGHDVL